jgi:hypothetical protein
MITQSGPNAYANLDGARAGLDASARKRADRLARATTGQMQAALALLSMLDPEAFEIAFTAVTAAGDGVVEDEVPVPACRRCGALIGIFPDRGLRWRHFRGDSVTSGVQEVYEPGHTAQVSWILAAEDQQEL